MSARVWFGIVATGWLASLAAWAGEDCDCDRYAEYARVARLAQEANVPAFMALAQQGGGVVGAEEARGHVRLQIQALRTVPESCRAKLFGVLTPRLSLSLRAAIDLTPHDPSARTVNPLVVGFESGVVGNLLSDACFAKALGEVDIYQCYATQSEAQKPRARQALNDMIAGNAAGQAWLGNMEIYAGGRPTVAEIRTLKAYYDFVMAPAGQRVGMLEKWAGEWSFADKVRFAAILGAKESGAGTGVYDKDRKDAGLSAKGAVDYNAMLDAMGKTTSSLLPDAWAGVCRDIASLQAWTLRKLGVPNSYVLAYDMTASNMLHVTTVTQDPRTKQIYTLNYGDVKPQVYRDTRALTQGGDDRTLVYRIFNPADNNEPGGQAIAVPSEMGKALNEMAAGQTGSLQALYPLARSYGSLMAPTLRLDSQGKALARAGYASDGSGARYLFAAGHVDYGNPEQPQLNYSGSVGAAAGWQHRPEAQYNENLRNQMGYIPDLGFLFTRWDNRLRSPELKVTPELKTRLEAMVIAMNDLTVGSERNKDLSVATTMPHGAINVGAHADYQGRDRSAHGYVGVQGTPTVRDVQDSSLQVPVVAFNYFVFTVEGRQKLMATQKGRALLMAAATLVVDQLGPKARLELGASVPQAFDASFFIEGCLSPGCMQITDGSERRAGASVRVNALPWGASVGAQGSYSFDTHVPSFFITPGLTF